MNEYVGGYEDWLRQSKKSPSNGDVKTTDVKEVKKEKSKSKNKLSYNDQRELDGLPQTIENLEAEQESFQQQISDAGFYQQEQTVVDKVLKRLSEVEKELELAYQRWEELGD